MTGLLMTIIPFVVFSVSTYSYINNRVITPFSSLITKQQQVLVPINKLQVSVWGISTSVADFFVSEEVNYQKKYYYEAQHISNLFMKLKTAIEITNKKLIEDISYAEFQWKRIDENAQFIFANLAHGSDKKQVLNKNFMAFENKSELLGKTLADIYNSLHIESEVIHAQAIDVLIHAEKLYLAILLVSILLGILGLMIINYSLKSSLDKLTEGASKFATGDSRHTIDIDIPIEMASVAHTFNAMKDTIIKQRNKLERAAEVDHLTGLLNRRKLNESLNKKIHLANVSNTHVSVIMVDIDHFKKFNDKYGHLGGDQVLITFADICRSAILNKGSIFRYGGEEFIIILPSYDISQAALVAEELRQAINNTPITIENKQSVFISASFGVATYSRNGDTCEKLIALADNALYISKDTGRNRVTVAS
jgi:diguanylate cyclase (GGDEF)-like protein